MFGLIFFVVIICLLVCCVLCCMFCKEDQSIVETPRDDRADTSYVRELREKCRQVTGSTIESRAETDENEVQMENRKKTKVHEADHARKGSQNYRNAVASGPIRSKPKHVI